MALEAKMNLREIEAKYQSAWDGWKIHQFKEHDGQKPLYVIDTPPPFPTGEFHTGSTLNWGYIDFAARYKRMQGYNVLFPQGWDCHGFPTETKVEKKFGRGLSREEFRQKCLEFTRGNIAAIKEQMNALGFSIDWRHEYYTIDREYHRKVQISLVRMFKEGLVYRQEHPVLWCPHCRSAITKAETEEQSNTTMLNFVRFGIAEEGDKGEGFAVATTRPEMLHACVAVAVHPQDGENAKLIGKKAVVPIFNLKVPIIADPEVDREFGTGVVMICTYGDKQDVVWAYRHKLPVVDACDGAGILKNCGKFDGKPMRESRPEFIRELQALGALLEQRPAQQILKTHDRCKKPIEMLRSTQWFCKLKGLEDRIKTAGNGMSWTPPHSHQLFDDWVDGLEWDWCISRQRVFGIPIPFWYCEKCGEGYSPIEKELPVDPSKDAAPKSIGAKCKKCGHALRGEASICDGWVDSSITPLVISGWPDDEKSFKRLYPNAMRPQGTDIIRTWGFYTTYRCLMLTGEAPFRDMLINGMVCGSDGKKMSKSLGNYVEAKDVIAKTSVDALRQWIALSGSTGKDIVFNWKDVNYAQSFVTKMWNASRFVQRALEGYDHAAALAQVAEGVTKKAYEELSLGISDKWVLSRLAKLVRKATESMNAYDYYGAITAIHSFFWHDFCDYYLEDVKHRVYGERAASKLAAQYTLHEVLKTALKLLAPISPYCTEEVYLGLGFGKGDGARSIHESAWPKPLDEYENDSIEQVCDRLHFLLSEVRKHKAANSLALNEPIKSAQVSGSEAEIRELADYESELKAVGKIGMVQAKVVPGAEGLKIEIG